MRVEIVSTEVKTRTVVSKRDGKEYTFYQQEAWLHDGTNPYPTRCFVPVSGLDAFYHPGRYRLASDAITVDRFCGLTLRRRFGLVSDEV